MNEIKTDCKKRSSSGILSERNSFRSKSFSDLSTSLKGSVGVEPSLGLRSNCTFFLVISLLHLCFRDKISY